MYSCEICPFECGVDREFRFGVCGLPRKILVSHYQRHFFEEPFISGESAGRCDESAACLAQRGCAVRGEAVSDAGGSSGSGVGKHSCGGSGTVFFSGCNGKCVFCQNHKISRGLSGGKEVSEERLFEICDELISQGAHNINFVSPTPYSEMLRDFLLKYKSRIGVPVIWNSNGYEKASTISDLNGLVDVYLPDLKYFSDELAVKYSSMPRYFKFASAAISEMVKQVGWPKIGDDGFIEKGVVIRHLVLPGLVSDSKKILKWINGEFGNEAYVALMAQYYPTDKSCEYPEINRTLSQAEYDEISSYFVGLGFEDGLLQELVAADAMYTPEF